jgi:hypothetical protein
MASLLQKKRFAFAGIVVVPARRPDAGAMSGR